MTNCVSSSNPLQINSKFILTDVIIPIISAGIAAWVGLDLLDKLEDKLKKKNIEPENWFNTYANQFLAIW